jgi:hypothetical protein
VRLFSCDIISASLDTRSPESSLLICHLPPFVAEQINSRVKDNEKFVLHLTLLENTRDTLVGPDRKMETLVFGLVVYH